MTSIKLPYPNAADLVAALANKQISSVDLLEQTISHIEQSDKTINAIPVRDFERARKQAKAADAAIAEGKQLPLLGLPMTVKESFNVAGLPTTWGNPHYKNWHPQEDALAVTRLKNAGAIIIGKTNVPFMLQDWQSYNDIYGTTNNPWDLKRTSGGSSGGAAAALAAGFVSLELGSDFAGSLRVPSHYCGVLAHKPSIHLVPMRGAGPPTAPPSPNPISDLIVAGPMARTARDLALALDVLAGPDELWDGKGYTLSLRPARFNKINQYRVLVLDTHPLCPTAATINNSIDSLIDRLTKVGVTVTRNHQSTPDLAEITRNYMTLFTAFLSGSIPLEEYLKAESSAKTLLQNDISISACLERGLALTHRDWLFATRTRGQLRQQWRNLYNEFDVVICPVMPTPAFLHDHSDSEKRQIEIDGVLVPFTNQFVWNSIATLFGLPATAAPIGLSEEGLPIGVQIIGDYLEDYTTIKFAELLEGEFGMLTLPTTDQKLSFSACQDK